MDRRIISIGLSSANATLMRSKAKANLCMPAKTQVAQRKFRVCQKYDYVFVAHALVRAVSRLVSTLACEMLPISEKSVETSLVSTRHARARAPLIRYLTSADSAARCCGFTMKEPKTQASIS